MPNKINIALAEDHELVRKGFAYMLKTHENIDIVFEANDGKELLQSLKVTQPEVLLLDIEMPILDGKKALKKIKKYFPQVKVIVISAHSTDSDIVEYVTLGADSFLPKTSNQDSLITAINSVSANGKYFEIDVKKLMDKFFPPPPKKKERNLSQRETKFAIYLAQEKKTSAIAQLLDIDESTCVWYKYNVLQKTGCADAKELKKYLVKKGIL